LGGIVAPVIASIEDGQRLGNVEVPEVERWERPESIEEAIKEKG
jgi:hypothetical protein